MPWEHVKRAQWAPVFKDERVSKWTYPNRLVTGGKTITVGDTPFRVHELGPGGDCDANSIWVMAGETPAVFVGDLVFNGTHSYLADGHTTDWLRNLERVRTLIPEDAMIYPGHGDSVDVSLLHAQAGCLHSFRDAVRYLSGGHGTLSDDAQSELTRRMKHSSPAANFLS